MFFFIKPSVIHLDCFTQDARVHKFHPISPATNFYPAWWKNLPKTVKTEKVWWGGSTMKSCTGFIEYYKNSISIPLWSELVIGIQPGTGVRWQFADHYTSAEVHNEEQFKNFVDPKSFLHLKILSPWLFKTKKSIKWSWNFPVWNYNTPDELVILPGVINFKYIHSTHINMFINITQATEIFLNANTPIINLIPMSDNHVTIHNHLVDADEYKKIIAADNFPAYFFNRYQKSKKYRTQLEAKCPFGFDKK
jgi:hypothetical protein